MFCLNKTGDWLQTKSPGDREAYIEEAMRDVPNMQVKYNERKKEIKIQREANLKKKER